MGGIGDYESFFQIKDQVVSIGHYAREELKELIQKHQVQLILLLSVWPETYSYTMSEALMLGVPFIATDMGALGHRARAYGCGLLVPLNSAVASIASLLTEILEKPRILSNERKKIHGRRNNIKTRPEFNADLSELYASFLPPRATKTKTPSEGGS